MPVTDDTFAEAEQRANAQRESGYAVAARYDRRSSRVVAPLNTDVRISFPARLAEGLAGAAPEDLAKIEITPSGLGLHWPKLDASLYAPGLRHARACPGHPRRGESARFDFVTQCLPVLLTRSGATWMAGTSPGHDGERRINPKVGAYGGRACRFVL